MYSPDGFASLACALHGQCWFLGYQAPYVALIQFFNTPLLFFTFQTLVWFALIGLVYFLAKEMKLKHLFITPFLILFGTTFFVDNFVGNFENDCLGIILILLGFIFYYRFKHKRSLPYFALSSICFITSLNYWVWAGYIIRVPTLIHPIVEIMFWTHWGAYLFLFPLMILCIISGIKYKDPLKIWIMLEILFFPKLFILGVPVLMQFIDGLIDKALKEENAKFIITILIFALIVGQVARVGIAEYGSVTRVIEDENCVTVNDEYFLRATKGLNYTYNQLDTGARLKCMTNTPQPK